MVPCMHCSADSVLGSVLQPVSVCSTQPIKQGQVRENIVVQSFAGNIQSRQSGLYAQNQARNSQLYYLCPQEVLEMQLRKGRYKTIDSFIAKM